MRMVTIKDRTDFQALSARLLKANLSTPQSEKALASLRALNPHADIHDVPAGTVLLVPDTPGFKVSESDPVLGDALGELQKIIQTALEQAAANLKASRTARTAERAEITVVLKGDALKRLMESDGDLKQQVADASKALKEEEADQAEEVVARTSKAALAKITELRKRVG
jgi:hypothetical protein